MTPRVLRRWRRFSVPVLGSLTAAMYLVVALGIPLPLPTGTKDLSVPFPCMYSSCGCRTADQCWKSCCCHSPAERLAWSRRHGIVAPLTLVKTIADNQAVQFKSSSSCTSTESCCDSGLSARASCCSKPGGVPHVSVHTEIAEDQESHSIIGIRALACHGHTMDWVANVIGMPPRIVVCEYRQVPIDFISADDFSFASATFPPPVPPPRMCAG
jgi:hypothetical protein